jgi:hypothetical protein
VRFKLRAAILVAAGVVKNDAALPQLWRHRRHKLRHLVETCGGFRNAGLFEILNGAVEDLLR